MLWKLDITDLAGKVTSMVSGTRITFEVLREGDVLLFVGEYDTLGFSIGVLSHFHIYETGRQAG